MLNRQARKIILWLFIATATVAIFGCAQPPPEPVSEKKEEPVMPSLPPQDTQTPDPKKMPKLPPPRPAEIKEAVERVFQKAAIVDTSRNPYFLVGDFNGDASQDLSVIVKPAEGKLSEMNQEYPSWMLKDPFNPNLPPQLRKEPLRVEEKDLLLAVIHGYGPNGWRNPEATQTYLLKNAVGSGIDTHTTNSTLTTNKGKKTPKLYGDTITQVLDGTPGYLYYTGASYAWYDPKSFKPETERRMAHKTVAAQK
jgi:hypothetical protein